MISLEALNNPPAIIFNIQADRGVGNESVAVARKWKEEVLPHFCAPASRQQMIELLGEEIPSIVDDVELDSPSFVPQAAIEFEARGFVRKNRWTRRG